MGSHAKHINPMIKEAFQGCQDSFSGHPKIVKKLKAFYLSTDPDKFFEDFIFYLRYPISGVTERSAYVDRTLDFVAKFACSFLEKDIKVEEDENSNDKSAANDDEDEDEELPLFMYRLYAWLLDHHEVEGADARLRVCQLLNKLLKYMGEEACIDDDLYNKIYDGMLERLKDKVPEIRSQAVTALQRLQDPRDEECPIIRAYLFHLAHDPNNIVRRTIVRCIGATRLTLPHILERTRDTDEHVRRAAYLFLAEKVHIKSLTIGQREGVLARGLGERSEAVRRVVEKEMIPGWLRLSNNNIVQLLHHLDVGNSDQDTKAGSKNAPAGALNVLFIDTPYRELVNSFQYLDTNKLIPYDKLTPETAMYWRVLAEYLSEQKGPGAEEFLEMILPELTPFCLYLRKYVLELEKDDEDGSWEFVAKELIRMTNIYDLGDEVGRQNLCKLVKDLLISNKTPVTFITTLVTVFTRVEKNTQSRIDQVAEIISELNDPMVADTQSTGPTSVEDSSSAETPLQPPMQDEEVIRGKQLQMAKIRVEVNQLRDQLDEAVTAQNFLIAQQIKAQMDQLEGEQVMLEDQLSVAKAVGVAPPSSASAVNLTPPETAAQLDLSDDQVGDDPAVTLKCLKLLVSTLQDPSITQMNSTLHTLLEEFITVSVQSERSAIRKEAITALACCCLRSIENARQHMLLLLQAAHIDVHEVRIAAITAVVDLLMKHGLSSFITIEETNLDLSGGDSNSRCADSVDSHSNIDNAMESDLATRGATLTQSELNMQGGNSVVAILTKILDEPDLELRTEVAEGLCKLLMIGAINSPKLLSRLLLIWYNPMTESDSKLRHILGTFFPLYSSMSKLHQMSVEAAFIPTMKVLFDAPVTSPLAEIDTEDVGMFFVHLTREDMLQSYDANAKDTNIIESTTTTVHDSLAMAVCNEILSAPDSFQTKVLIKILTSLLLTHNNYVHLRELKVLAELLLQNVKEKTCVRSLEKFDKQLSDWLAKDPSRKSKVTPSASKRKGKDSDGDESLDKSWGASPSRRKKRSLFSQSMIGNPLLHPEPGQVLESHEEVNLAGSSSSLLGIDEASKDNTTRVDSGNEIVEQMENGDKTLIDAEEDAANIDKTLIDAGADPTREEDADKTKDDSEEFLSADSSFNGCDDSVISLNKTEISSKQKPEDTATHSFDILTVDNDDEDQEEETDVFSDASSLNLSSKHEKTTTINSSETGNDKQEIVEKATNSSNSERGKTKSKSSKKSPVSKDISSILEASSSPISISRSTRSSRSSIVSSPTPSSGRSSRSSRAGQNKLSRSGRVNSPLTKTDELDETPAKRGKAKTATVTKSTKKTHVSKIVQATSSSSRKRGKTSNSSSASSSSTRSPVPKRASARKSSKKVKTSPITDSDDSDESNPASEGSASSATSRRSLKSKK